MSQNDYRRRTIRYIHWSPGSQPIARPEILVNRLQRGWVPARVVKTKNITYTAGKKMRVYHFTLQRDNEVMEMPVYNSPAVRRILDEYKLEIVASDEATDATFAS